MLNNIHAIGNAVEACVWWLLASVLMGIGWRNTTYRRHCLQAAGVLVAFGFSDVVEIQTGAWWRPWWLLVWKGACLLAMLRMWWYRPRK